jgi:hypothetical protein
MKRVICFHVPRDPDQLWGRPPAFTRIVAACAGDEHCPGPHPQKREVSAG